MSKFAQGEYLPENREKYQRGNISELNDFQE